MHTTNSVYVAHFSFYSEKHETCGTFFPELTAAFAHARKLGQYSYFDFAMLCSFNVQPYVSDIVEVYEARKQLET